MERLFDMKFYDKSLSNLVEELGYIIDRDKKASIFTPNVDHIINLKENYQVKEKYIDGDYIIADGWPLVAVGKIKGINVSRITGVDLMDSLLELANEKGYGLYFLGAQDDTLNKLSENIKGKYKNITEINYHHGYFKNDDEIISYINNSKTNILFVGMGNPKQEIWIKNNIEKLNINIAIGVGGAFKIFSEEIERAPRWVQKIGMEWFYRFTKEPKRLFGRYFIKYPKFIKYTIKEIMN